MQQVIGNILSNAIKFTPSGGQVDLRLARADGKLQISVSDQGEGIGRMIERDDHDGRQVRVEIFIIENRQGPV